MLDWIKKLFKKKRKKKKKFVPTSKKLTWVITVVWILTIIAYFATLIFTGMDATPVVISVAGTYGIVVAFYFYRSANKNSQSYVSTQYQLEDFDNPEMG